MGEMVRTWCDTCDIDRQDFLGWGMTGTSRTLCSCSRCGRLVVKHGRWDDADGSDKVLRCPYCKRPLMRVFTNAEADGALSVEAATCPTCKGQLRTELFGMWD